MSLPTQTDLLDRIKGIILRRGPISFHDFMQIALYEPELGYYQQTSPILGAQGDFITAPELTCLFGKTLSRQVAEIAQDLGGPYTLMEIGPGRGKLMKDLLAGLSEQAMLPEQAVLVEASETLIKVQQQTLAEVTIPIQWQNSAQGSFEGIVIANELIDALPVHRVRLSHEPQEWYVTLDRQQNLVWQLGSLSSKELQEAITKLMQSLDEPLPEDYDTEINLNQEKILKSLSQCLTRGVVLLIDYGFDARQYYHRDRAMGTLMTHQAHKSHSDPLAEPGKKDITAHVDFTKLTIDALACGFSLLGYTTQAHFLLGCGLLDELQKDHCLTQTQGVQTLTATHEMGELIKVIAFGKDFENSVKGFQLKDFSHYL